MDIILFRHAKAEDVSPLQLDLERRLTPTGIHKARLAAKGLRKLLVTPSQAEIWASPAARCRETGAILAEELGITKRKTCPDIYHSKLEPLLATWQKRPDSDVIILVGHEPYLGNWLKQLTRTSLSFKKCGAACCKLCVTEGTSSLQWYVAPKILIRLGQA